MVRIRNRRPPRDGHPLRDEMNSFTIKNEKIPVYASYSRKYNKCIPFSVLGDADAETVINTLKSFMNSAEVQEARSIYPDLSFELCVPEVDCDTERGSAVHPAVMWAHENNIWVRYYTGNDLSAFAYLHKKKKPDLLHGLFHHVASAPFSRLFVFSSADNKSWKNRLSYRRSDLSKTDCDRIVYVGN